MELQGVLEKDNVLFEGSFGVLLEGYWLDSPCLVRIPTIQENFKISDSIRKWSAIRHPHIVQFLGTTKDKEDIRFIVTEYLPFNLTSLLGVRKRERFPLFVKARLLLGVARALNFLHSKDPVIIHKNVTASCVFVSPDMSAKLDLGSVFNTHDGADIERHHLPPEVTLQDSVDVYLDSYTKAGDMFSLGVLCLHVLIQELPTPKPSFRVIDEDQAFFYSEIERRDIYLEKLTGQERLFLPLITRCIKGSMDERPPADEFMASLSQLLVQLCRQCEDVLDETVANIHSKISEVSLQNEVISSETKHIRSQLSNFLEMPSNETYVPNSPPLDKSRSLRFNLSINAANRSVRTLPSKSVEGMRSSYRLTEQHSLTSSLDSVFQSELDDSLRSTTSSEFVPTARNLASDPSAYPDHFKLDEVNEIVREVTGSVNSSRKYFGSPLLSSCSSREPSLEEDNEVVEMQKNPAYFTCQRERFTQGGQESEAPVVMQRNPAYLTCRKLRQVDENEYETVEIQSNPAHHQNIMSRSKDRKN